MEINSKQELHDVLNYERKRWKLPEITNWHGWLKLNILLMIHPGSPYLFMVSLRYVEYYQKRTGGGKILCFIYTYRMRKLQNLTGIDMWPGVAEKGVKVNHGKCVVSKDARIGRDSIILSDVTIGGAGGTHMPGAATIGERVLIGTGAKIIGRINICNDVVIGANAVVIKDITEPCTVWGGIPARKISVIKDNK